MIGDRHRLTTGWVLRHLPPGSVAGADIAVLDIAQDFLLAHLHGRSVFDDLVVFKGGTALRKLFAGAQGRFSTDIDLAVRSHRDDRRAVADLIAEHCDVALGPFRYSAQQQRGRWKVAVTSELGDPGVTMKLEVGPPCWLQPQQRPFVPQAVHDRYGFALPALPCMQLEEVLAEKIARLTRRSTARDASDLMWAASTVPHSTFDRSRVRRLAVLKVWADNNRLAQAWQPALDPRPFDPAAWLDARPDWDDEQIGLLAHPPPSLDELNERLVTSYNWLSDLAEPEALLARAFAGDRGAFMAALAAVPDLAIDTTDLY